VASVRKYNPDVDDPKALVGWIWHHHMKPGTKAAILKKTEISRYVKLYKKDGVKMAKRKRKRNRRALGGKVTAKAVRKTLSRLRSKGRKLVKKHKKVFKKKPFYFSGKTKHHRKGRSIMSKRRRKSRRNFRRFSGLGGMEGLGGFEGRRRRRGHRRARRQILVMGKRRGRRRSRRGLLMGQFGGNVMQRFGANTLNVAAGVAGGVGGAYLANMIPDMTPDANTNRMLKAAIPALAGILLASTVRMPALKFAGLGLGVVGGLSLMKTWFPQLPAIAGETTLLLPDRSLGALTDFSGAPVEFQTQADM